MDESETLEGYLSVARTVPVLPKATERGLLVASREGDKAATRALIEGYLELTAVLAVRLAPEWMDPIHAVQEANIVLSQVIEDADVPLPAAVLSDRLLTLFNALRPPEGPSG